jgi:TonB family protein
MTSIPMDDVFRPVVIRWTVLISAALHGALFVALALQIAKTEIVPIGVEVQYLDGGRKASHAEPVMKHQSVVRTHTKEKGEIKAAPAQPAAQSIATTAVNQGPAGRADGAIVSALDRYKYELRLFLESRKIYPESAKRLRQTGTVIVEFKVSPQGELKDVNVSQASSSEVLNRAALDLVKRASSFKPFPKELQISELQLKLPIEYVL